MKDLSIDSTSNRITRSIAYGFGFIFIAVCGLVIVSLIQLKEFGDNTNNIVKVNNLKTELVYKLQDSIRLRALSLQIMAGTDDYFIRDEVKDRFYSYATQYRNTREKLLKLPMSLEEKFIHKQLTAITRKVQPLNRIAVGMMTNNTPAEKLYQAVENARVGQFLLLKVLNEFVKIQKRLSLAAASKTKAQLIRSYYISGILILLGVLIGYFIYRKVINYVRDNTEFLHSKNSELKEAYHNASEATKTKSRFLANMSHEIRTPLNGVLGMLQLLNDTELKNIQKQYIRTASSSADILLTLINDILDLSKIEAGKLTIEKAVINLEDIIEECCSFHALKAHQNGVELACNIDSDTPKYLIGDSTRLQQVLSNLMSNAVKFTKQGTIKISVKSENIDEDIIRLFFRVEDSGIGISKEAQENLFNAFTQADNSVTRKYGGTGLGLTICRQLVEMMNGKLEINSVLGRGTCFSFDLEMEHSGQKTQTQHLNFLDANILILGKKSLGIDITMDYLDELNLAYDGLYKHTMEMKQATIDYIDSYDCIIIDVPTNLKNSDEYSQFLIYLENNLHTPIIVLSNIGLRQVASSEAATHTYIDQIQKPIHKHHLYLSLQKALTLQCYIAEHIDESSEKVKINSATILLVEDNMVNQMVAKAMLEKLGHEVAIAENGEKALELYQESNFSLILMDCQMPVMDGFTTTKEIRKIEAITKSSTPIIALTANASDEDRKNCMDAGMNDFLTKPYKQDKLNDIIKQALKSEIKPLLSKAS